MLPPDLLLREETAYPIATAHLPAWVEASARPAAGASGSCNAATLFIGRGSASSTRPSVPGVDQLPWRCFPELLTAPRARFHPAYTGKIKSAVSSGDKGGSLRMFDELLTYSMLGILGSFFSGVPPGARRFFRSPPLAFALAAFPHVGYLLAVEWAGKLLASVVSEPFFLGSPAHKAAVARLPDCNMEHDFEELRLDTFAVAAWPSEAASRPAVLWRTAPPTAGEEAPFFFKLLRGEGFDAAFFRRVAAAYAAYAAARGAARGPLPTALVDAELLFGAGELCVRMPWVHGRDATVDELGPGGTAVAPVAAALVWLARRGLLYVDLREPNVRVDGSRVALIDYDDMVALERAPVSAEELLRQLHEHGARFAGPLGEPGARPAVVAALHEEWARSSSA